VVSKNKITLVHLWASNSYHIEDYRNELLTLYEKYHKKGLEVIGLSADTDPRKWKIGMLDIPWLNVSDLKGDKGIVQQVYREFPNPGKLIRRIFYWIRRQDHCLGCQWTGVTVVSVKPAWRLVVKFLRCDILNNY